MSGSVFASNPSESTLDYSRTPPDTRQETPSATTRPAASLESARERYLRGEYDQAIQIYDELKHQAAYAISAACGRAEIDLQRGDYADGIERFMTLARPGESSADWHASLAALLVEVGRYPEAEQHNRRALAIDPRHYRASWQLGQLLEELGRYEDARSAYARFEQTATEGPLPEHPEELTWLGEGFLRHTVLSRNPNLAQRTKHVLQEIYQEAFDHVDVQYWPARLAAAELLLEKHNLNEATDDFSRIIEQNPHVPAAHTGLGQIAVERWDLDKAETHAQAALAINPRFVPAHLLIAELRIIDRHFREAAAAVDKALETNAYSIPALSLRAAIQLTVGDLEASRKTQEQVAGHCPRSAVLHYWLGKTLSLSRQFTAAEEHLRRAVEYAPFWPEPRTELGQVYMENGEEDKARGELEASFALDRFNLRTFTVLNLLDQLDRFARWNTPHFIIRYDEAQDFALAPLVAEALEEMYPEICAACGYQPEKPTVVELFPDHFGFSVRISARPFISTVGACSGRVIAMAAPRRDSAFGSFNWKTVLRHEFTHTVTLEATGNRIPRWLTEGLAVLQEPPPRSWQVKQLLSAAVRKNDLYTTEALDWGFIRPSKPGGQGLTYAQGAWMVEYLCQRYGKGVLSDLQDGFRQGLPQPRVFEQVLKCTPEAFDRDFRAWAQQQVDQWGLPKAADDDPDKLLIQLKDRPHAPNLLARMAMVQLSQGNFDSAEATVRQVIPMVEQWPSAGSNPSPNVATTTQPWALPVEAETSAREAIAQVLVASMLSMTDDTERTRLRRESEPHLRRLHELAPENPVGIKYLGYVEQGEERWPEAIALYRRYLTRYPEDPDPHRRLAAIYRETQDMEAAISELHALFRLVDDDAYVARQLASLYADRHDAKSAIPWWHRSLEIDPYDLPTHRALAESYLDCQKYDAAEQEYRLMARWLPDDASISEALNKLRELVGQSEKATPASQPAEPQHPDREAKR